MRKKSIFVAFLIVLAFGLFFVQGLAAQKTMV